VVVNDFDIVGIAVAVYEANPEPVIDPDAMRSSPIAFQDLQAVAERDPQIVQHGSEMELGQFP
jgi:hypothetical protein